MKNRKNHSQSQINQILAFKRIFEHNQTKKIGIKSYRNYKLSLYTILNFVGLFEIYKKVKLTVFDRAVGAMRLKKLLHRPIELRRF